MDIEAVRLGSSGDGKVLKDKRCEVGGNIERELMG